MTKTTKVHMPMPNLMAHLLPLPRLAATVAPPPAPTRGADRNALEIGGYAFGSLFQALLASPIVPRIPDFDIKFALGTIKAEIQFEFGTGTLSIDDSGHQVTVSLPIAKGKILYGDTTIDYSGVTLSVTVGIRAMRLEFAVTGNTLATALYLDSIDDLPRISIDKPPPGDVLGMLINLENDISLPILQYFGCDGFVFPPLTLPKVLADLAVLCKDAVPTRLCPTSFRDGSQHDALVARILAGGRYAMADFHNTTGRDDNAALIASNAYLLQAALFPVLQSVLINLQASLRPDYFQQPGQAFVAEPQGAIRLDSFAQLAERPIFAEIKDKLLSLAKLDDHLTIDFMPKFSLTGDILTVTLELDVEYAKSKKKKSGRTKIKINLGLTAQVVIASEATTPPSDVSVKLVPKSVTLAADVTEGKHILELEAELLILLITLAAIAIVIPFLYALEVLIHFCGRNPMAAAALLRVLYEQLHDVIDAWKKKMGTLKKFLKNLEKFIKQVEADPTSIANLLQALDTFAGLKLTIDDISPRINIPLDGCHVSGARLVAGDDLRIMGQVIAPK